MTAQQQTNPHPKNDKGHYYSIQTRHTENLLGVQLLPGMSDSSQP